MIKYLYLTIFLTFSFATPIPQPMVHKKRCCALEPCMDHIVIKSPTFETTQPMPVKHVYPSCKGQNISPELHIKCLPLGTKSLVIIVEDPDAPSPAKPRKNPWIHWIVYDLPPCPTIIPEGVKMVQFGGKEGNNDFGARRYDGPCPPVGSGRHRYFFKMYALNIQTLGLPVGASKAQVMTKMDNHIIGYGELIGTYEIKP